MNDLITNIIAVLLDSLVEICGLLFTCVFLPWVVNTGIPWLKEKRLYSIVGTFVKAAEKMAEAGTLTIPKNDYVVKMLEAKGITVTQEVRAMIEARVIELDIAVKNGVGLLGDVFVESEVELPTERENAEHT